MLSASWSGVLPAASLAGAGLFLFGGLIRLIRPVLDGCCEDDPVLRTDIHSRIR
jgi:hypothetical protein